jgi:Iap family predicted aminopeptidase
MNKAMVAAAAAAQAAHIVAEGERNTSNALRKALEESRARSRVLAIYIVVAWAVAALCFIAAAWMWGAR